MIKNTNSSVRDIVRIAVMTAIIALCSILSIPMPLGVPITLQTFALFFVLEFSGGKNGTVSFLLYALIGALGAPVFSGLASGIGYLAGPTGGFLIGFVFSCLIFWAFEKKIPEKRRTHYLVVALSMAACYVSGTVWFAASSKSGVSFASAFAACVLPFIIPDIVKIALAVIVARRIKKIIKI